MSDDSQNKRSPDQQFATIHETIERCECPWRKLRSYRDDGISGRYVRKRPAFQRMLRDIATGAVKPDLIVVDTYQRFGRADEVDEIRRKLRNNYGILIVAADNDFADPTGIVGKAVGMIESVCATEEGRIKCHNVIRGKKDAARRKRWPGGPRPFGLALRPIVDHSSDPPDVYSVLELDPEEAWIQQRTFQKAFETGWGRTRMAQWYNTNPDIPEKFKPISEHTMAYRLSNPIYIGMLVWGEHSTDIVNDTRVVERNPENEVERIPDFCEPLISREVFEEVQLQARLRAEAYARIRRKKEDEGKLIQPIAPGLSLTNLLAGLVRCSECEASMRPVTSGRRSKAGRKYTYYKCPRQHDGGCDNKRSVPEDSLREAVVTQLRSRLFPLSQEPGQVPEWFPGLVEQVKQELSRDEADHPCRRASAEAEIRRIDEQLTGWVMTLADPKLPARVRTDIAANYELAKSHRDNLAASQAEEQARNQCVEDTFNAKLVVERLHRLSEVLGSGNPTLGNRELSRHIDRITCHPDGRIVIRGTLLGVFDGAVELLSRPGDAAGSSSMAFVTIRKVKPRTRGRLRVDELSAEGQQLVADLDSRLDPERFSHLADEFVWEESVYLPRKLSWAEENAVKVARLRLKKKTIDDLVNKFGKSIPTIRSALRHAAKLEEFAGKLPSKQPRSRWHEDHAAEVAAMKVEAENKGNAVGSTVRALARHFKKSEPTIRKALEYAKTSQDASGAVAVTDSIAE